MLTRGVNTLGRPRNVIPCATENYLGGYARRGTCLVGYVTSLKCRGCSRETEIGPYNVFDYCFGPLAVVYDYEAMRPSISREAILN